LTAAHGLRAQARSKTHLYVQSGPGQYRLDAVYSVDPTVALRAYQLDPAASKAGSGTMYLKEGDTGREIGSASGFRAYLDAHYPREPRLADEAPCDDTINLAFNLTCNFSCAPPVPTICDGSLGLGVTLTCLNDPPCAAAKDCVPFLGRLTGVTTNQQACDCTGPGNTCELQAGTVVTTVTASGPLCDCVGDNSTDVPTLSLWALLAATLLTLVIGITMLRRRAARS
jgi:hypothetical protein